MKIFIRVIIGLIVLSGVFTLLASKERQSLILRKLGLLTEQPVDLQTEMPQRRILKPVKKLANTSCAKVASVTLNNQRIVYEWLDLNGQKQISDRRPKRDYAQLRIQKMLINKPFLLSVDSVKAQLPAYTKDHVSAGIKKIYKTLINAIKVRQVRPAHIKMRFISNQNQFHVYRIKVAPDTGNKTTGFYSSRINESVIWATGDRSHITRIALHEATHAMIAVMFGGAPTWLNEGLASFFEKTVITGNDVYSYELIDEHLSRLGRSKLPSLASHFIQTHQQWHDESKSDMNYAIDWSLVFYMMSSDNGRNLLRLMLDSVAEINCQDFDAVQFINQHHEGGLRRFEIGWRQWVESARKNTTMTIHGL